MNKKLLKNFIYQGSYQILITILPIITIPIISRSLGPDGVGTWNYINSIVSYFILIAGLGLNSYGVREIALSNSSKEKLSKKFWELEFFNLFFSLITFIIYIFFSIHRNNSVLFLIQGLALLGSLFDISWFFSGIEDFKKVTQLNFIVKTLSFICILLFINNKNDLWKYFLIQSLSILISQISFWFFLKNKISFVKVNLKDCIQHFFPALSFFIAKIAGNIFFNINKTILGILTSMSIVGYFSNSLSMVWMATNLVSSLNIVMIPRMSSLFGKNNTDEMDKLLEQTIHFQLFLTILVSFGIITINDKMIVWFFGTDFLPITHMVPYLAPIVVFQSLHAAIANQYLIPRGEIKSYNYTIIIATIFTVSLDLVLIPIIGIYGAIIGLLLGQIMVMSLRIKALQKTSSFTFHWRSILIYLVTGTFMWGTTFLLTKNMNSNFITTLIQIIVATSIYFIVTTLFKCNPASDLLLNLWERKKQK